MTKREIQADNTKKKLREVAQDLILEKGMDKFTMKDLAVAAGVSVGAVYLYYPSKAELQKEFEDFAYDDILEQILNDPDFTFGQKLYYYNIFWYENGEKMGAPFLRGWYRFTLDIEKRRKEGAKELRIAHEIESEKRLLRAGIESGELNADTPVDELAEILICTRQGSSMYWALTDGAVPRRRLAEEYLYCVLEPALQKYGLKSAIMPKMK